MTTHTEAVLAGTFKGATTLIQEVRLTDGNYEASNPYPTMIGRPAPSIEMFCTIERINVRTYAQADVRRKIHRFCLNCGTQRLRAAR